MSKNGKSNGILLFKLCCVRSWLPSFSHTLSLSLFLPLCTSSLQWSRLPPCNLPNREAHTAGNWGRPTAGWKTEAVNLTVLKELNIANNHETEFESRLFPVWVLRFLCAWPAPWIQHCKKILSQRALLNNAQIPGPQNLWNKQFSGSLEQVIYTTCCIWGCRLKK